MEENGAFQEESNDLQKGLNKENGTLCWIVTFWFRFTNKDILQLRREVRQESKISALSQRDLNTMLRRWFALAQGGMQILAAERGIDPKEPLEAEWSFLDFLNRNDPVPGDPCYIPHAPFFFW